MPQKNHRASIHPDRLWVLRNQIDFTRLFRRLRWPWKRRDDGVILFVCPQCHESQSSVNLKTNLARCFPCSRNWNPIDFTLEVTPMEFLEVVTFLEGMLPPPQQTEDRLF